jgi:dipeptidyl aminopeptidase/acylaminoacyl peptidase
LYHLAFDPNQSTVSASSPVKITKEKGTHAVNWSNDWRYFIDTYSNRSTPPVTRLHKANGTLVKYLEDNAELVRTVAEYDFPKTEFLTVPGGGKPLHAYLIKPAKFDSHAQLSTAHIHVWRAGVAKRHRCVGSFLWILSCLLGATASSDSRVC